MVLTVAMVVMMAAGAFCWGGVKVQGIDFHGNTAFPDDVKRVVFPIVITNN